MFSILWTAIAFLLAREPYGYADGTIGLFGLAGLAGALMAPVAGHLSDAGHGRRAVTGALLVLVVSWVPLDLGGTSLVALLVGIVALDFAVQALQITNQGAIYALRPDARSRITTAFMVSVFLGGIGGSVSASLVWGAGGWDAVCILGAGVALFALSAWTWWSWTATRRAGRDGPAIADG